jgi:hypothetical protein
MMLGLGWMSRRWIGKRSARWAALTPAALALVSLLLVLRGLALGIPYVSPNLSQGAEACPTCTPADTIQVPTDKVKIETKDPPSPIPAP